jgi:hypothetical protein
VRRQRAAHGVVARGDLLPLPNPFRELKKTGQDPAPRIVDAWPPEQRNDGRRLFVQVEPIEDAEEYRGYVSAYPDGRGAQALAINRKSDAGWARYLEEPGMLFYPGLQPARPMYLFVTWLDTEGKESKPSDIREVILRDEFPFD